MLDADLSLQKLPPQNLEAELSLLGAVLIEEEAIDRVLEIISIDDFYRDAHRRIFQRMIELHEQRQSIDLITLSEILQRNNELDAVGGRAYLASLTNAVFTAANVAHYARIIREKSILRKLISASTEIITSAYEDSLEVGELIDKAAQRMFEISERNIRSSFVQVKEVVKDSFEMIERLYDRKESITGVATGFTDLDFMMSGMQSSDLIIVAGRPSMGKTSFCMNIAEHVAIDLKRPVGVFSLEMSKEQLVLRLLCSQAMVDAHRLRSGFLQDEDWGKLTMAAGRLSGAPLFIDDTPAISVMEMRAKARRLRAQHGDLGLVVVDYLQLMRGNSRVENRVQEVSEISRSLKALAKEIGAPVVALSQLSRAVESRTDKRPVPADLRESGSIEQDADVVIFIYRDEVYNRDNPDNKGTAEIIVAKQRNGPVGTVEMTFMHQYTKFGSKEKRHEF
ncbi:MAG: replicative DNA helicase [Nitrospirota bacterium]|nr:replicative DNA helicase [Nitrospirota bacterium]